MKEVILVKIGESVLKGLNRRTFEDILIKNIRRAIKPIGEFEIRNAQSTIYLLPKNDDIDLDEACEKVGKVFGIAAFSKACVASKNIDDIKKCALEYLKTELSYMKSFKVESKRADKKFELKSPEISRELGGFLYENFENLNVDVHNPEVIVTVEIREEGAYIHSNVKVGAGGLPVGTGGRAAILISGGIDSPVAAWMMAKRGIELTAIHFASPPYTSERAEQKVVDLLQKVSEYSGKITMITVPFTEIQEKIQKDCPEELFTIIMRRLMMRLAQIIAEDQKCQALITGESLGQVASQTIGAIACTDEAVNMPVFRPLIGMDKDEIVRISRKIDTFDISIQPFEDCCTVFTPKHPRTRPKLKFVKGAELNINWDEMIEKALNNLKYTKIGYRK